MECQKHHHCRGDYCCYVCSKYAISNGQWTNLYEHRGKLVKIDRCHNLRPSICKVQAFGGFQHCFV